MVVANFVFAAIKMAMAIKLSRVIKTFAFFYQLLFVYYCRRMTIELNGIDFAGINCLMRLDPGVYSYHCINT